MTYLLIWRESRIIRKAKTVGELRYFERLSCSCYTSVTYRVSNELYVILIDKSWTRKEGQLVPITTKVVSSNHAHGEVYSIQHHEIKFINDLRQVGGFIRVPLFPPPILTATIIKILLKMVLNTISLNPVFEWCCIEYTSPWAWFELTTLVVIGTNCIGSCKSIWTRSRRPLEKSTVNTMAKTALF
jgi:hypothetical protein